MNTPVPTTDGAPFRRRLFNRYTVIAFVAGAALAGGVGVTALAGGMSGCSHGMMMGGAHSAADVSAHVDHMLKHLYVEIDATDAQKAKIDPLVKQAVSDLIPLHSQLNTASSPNGLQATTPKTQRDLALELSSGHEGAAS